jgi:hypothetical protein
MFDISQLADTAGDYLSSANDLLKQGRTAYDTITGTGTAQPPQTAQDVAAAAPVKQPFNWKPWAIGAAILAALGGVLYFLTKAGK